MEFFGVDEIEVSSLIEPYSHLDDSNYCYQSKSQDSVDSKGVPTWVASDYYEEYLKKLNEEFKNEDQDEYTAPRESEVKENEVQEAKTYN